MSLPTLLPDHSSYMNTRPEQPLLHTDFKVLAPDKRKPLYPISWQERIYSGQEFYAASNTAVRNFISMGMLCQQIASECSIKCMYNMFISLQCMGYDSHGHRGNKIGPYIYHIILDVITHPWKWRSKHDPDVCGLLDILKTMVSFAMN